MRLRKANGILEIVYRPSVCDQGVPPKLVLAIILLTVASVILLVAYWP